MASTSKIVDHYAKESPIDRIKEQLRSVGVDLAALAPADISGVDEFHVGGQFATKELIKSFVVEGGSVLDVGSGIGGVARTIAVQTGSSVIGVDLTPLFVEAATQLSELVGMAGSTEFRVANATELPFDDAQFDTVTLTHVGMNIEDKPSLFRELARVLRRGGSLHVYDLMRISDAAFSFPVPWASTPEASFVVQPADYQAAIESAGLAPREPVNRMGWLKLAAEQSKGNPPVVNLSHLMGEHWATMVDNLGNALRSGVLAPHEIVATKN